MSYDPYDCPVEGHCPVCGSAALYLSFGRVTCFQKGCPDTDAANKLLDDPEIHHIVRFDEDGYYNAKHPLRERIDNDLLDCTIGDEVMIWMGTPTQARKNEVADTTWRVKKDNEHNYIWERLA